MSEKNFKITDKSLNFRKNNKTSRWWWGVLLVLVLVNIAWSGYIAWQQYQEKLPLDRLLPDQERLFFATLNKDDFFLQATGYENNIKNYCLFCSLAIKGFNHYLTESNLDYLSDFSDLFKEEMAIASYYQNQESNWPTVFLMQKKASSAQINRILNTLENQFKKDFHLSEKSYRQISITRLESVYFNQPVIYYAQTEDIFLVGTAENRIIKTIDVILNNRTTN